MSPECSGPLFRIRQSLSFGRCSCLVRSLSFFPSFHLSGSDILIDFFVERWQFSKELYRTMAFSALETFTIV